MRDSLEFMMRQRFRAHESPVDPGAWDAIQAQLQVPAGDPVNDLFRDRFKGHEVHVDPAVWQHIGQQLGHTAASGAAAGVLGWAAAGVGVVAIAGALLWWSGGNEAAQRTQEVTPVPVERVEVVEEPVATNSAEVVVAAVPEVSRPVRSEPTPAATPVMITERTEDDGPGTHPTSQPPITEALPTSPAVVSAPIVEERTDGKELVDGIIDRLTQEVTEEVRGTSTRTHDDHAHTAVAEEPEPVSVEPLPELFMPNTFTPNGDGINDTYQLSMEGFERMAVRVYAVKNNQLVFRTNGNEPWTGASCEDGYYLVAVEALAGDGRIVTQGKVVWLNRNPLN